MVFLQTGRVRLRSRCRFTQPGKGSLRFRTHSRIRIMNELRKILNSTRRARAVQSQGTSGIATNDRVRIVQTVDQFAD